MFLYSALPAGVVFCLLSFVWHLSLDSRAGTGCARVFSCVLVACSWSTLGVAFFVLEHSDHGWCSVGFRSGYPDSKSAAGLHPICMRLDTGNRPPSRVQLSHFWSSLLGGSGSSAKIECTAHKAGIRQVVLYKEIRCIFVSGSVCLAFPHATHHHHNNKRVRTERFRSREGEIPSPAPCGASSIAHSQ